MTKKLGELLVEREAILPRDLHEALQAQLTTGVRVGTALVQLEVVSLDTVGLCLGLQHGVPVPGPEQVGEIPREVLELVPRELCRRQVVLPFALEGDTLCLAMRDPYHHRASEISTTIRRPVRRFVLPELRIMYLLERHMGLARAPRFLREAAAPRGQDERRTHLAPTIQARAELDPNTAPDLLALAEATLSEHGLAAGLAEAIQAVRPVDVVLSKLGAASNGEAIVRLLVEPVLEETTASILFFVRKHHAVACCAHGIDTTADRLQRFVVPLGPPSLMQWASKMLSVLRGPPDPLQQEIALHFDLPQPGEVCVAPVVPKNKVVNLLCTWSRPGKRFPDHALRILGELANGAATAYLDLARRLQGR